MNVAVRIIVKEGWQYVGTKHIEAAHNEKEMKTFYKRRNKAYCKVFEVIGEVKTVKSGVI